MSEENKVEQTAPDTSTEKPEQVVEQKELSPIEKQAMDMGWRPREEFSGEDDEFIDAKEFVRRKPLFDKIENTTKEVKQLRKALDALRTHYTKVQETEYQRALSKLKDARQEAIRNSDGEAFEAIDTEIKRVEVEASKIEQVAQVPEEPVLAPEFVNWKRKNEWYDSVKYMREFADQEGVRLHSQGMSPKDVLEQVEKLVRKEFPHKFTNPNKANAPGVESGKPAGTGRKEPEIELTEAERKIMNTLVSTKQMTKEQYLADLKKVKGIK